MSAKQHYPTNVELLARRCEEQRLEIEQLLLRTTGEIR